LKAVFVPTARSEETTPHHLSWYIRQQERWIAGAVSEVVDHLRKTNHPPMLLLALLSFALSFSPATAFALIIIGGFSGNTFLLLGVLLAFLLFLASSLRLLKITDALISPFSFAILSVLQFLIIVRVFAKMSLGRKFVWYKTPKK
jgi:cellulose synthase/poly-beta-1,6-N-acetylglucosamine synthase-like glycosyltransferase